MGSNKTLPKTEGTPIVMQPCTSLDCRIRQQSGIGPGCSGSQAGRSDTGAGVPTVMGD